VVWLTKLSSCDRLDALLEDCRTESRPRNEDDEDPELPSFASRGKTEFKAATKRPVWVKQETFPELKQSPKVLQTQNKPTNPISNLNSAWGSQKTNKSEEVVVETEVKNTASLKGGRKKKWTPVSLNTVA
jgi:hypothetical protein